MTFVMEATFTTGGVTTGGVTTGGVTQGAGRGHHRGLGGHTSGGRGERGLQDAGDLHGRAHRGCSEVRRLIWSATEVADEATETLLTGTGMGLYVGTEATVCEPVSCAAAPLTVEVSELVTGTSVSGSGTTPGIASRAALTPTLAPDCAAVTPTLVG